MTRTKQWKRGAIACLLILFIMISLFPAIVFGVPNYISADQIGTVENGKVIFYANLNGGKLATPYAVGDMIVQDGGTGTSVRYRTTPNTPSDYTFFYSWASPNFSIIHSASDDTSNGGTMVEGTTVVLSSRNYSKVQSNAQMAEYIDASDPNLQYATNFSIVTGSTGKQNVLRIEYSVKNTSGDTVFVGGRMNADTMLGSINGDVTDAAQTIVDNPEQYVNSPENPDGFLYDGGEVRKAARFVSRQDGDSSYIHGIPLTWHNVMVFNETNPLSVFYSVKPDVASTADHFYPLPNVVDLATYIGALMPTGSFTPAAAGWIPLSKQRSGQTGLNNSFSYNNTPSVNTDSRVVVPFGDSRAQNMDGADSGTSIQWNKQKLDPGQTVSFVYFVGQGNVDIQKIGSLYYGFSAQNTRFPIDNNVIQPLNLQVSLRNSDTTSSVTNALVRLVYDPLRIQPLNPDGSNRVRDGVVTTDLNGVTASYDYVMVPVSSIAPSAFSNITFPVRGKNTTVDEVNTFVKAMIDYTDVDSTPYTDISTNELQMFIPGVLEEDRSPGFIHVKHVVQGTGEVLYQYDIAGVVGSRSKSYFMDFVNYELAPGQPEEQEDTLLRDNIVGGEMVRTQIYEYVPRVNDYNLGGVIIRHMGKAEIVDGEIYDVLLALEHVHGVIGDPVTVNNKHWPGYLFTPEQQSTVYTERPTEIVFEYDFDPDDGQGYLDVYNNSGRVLVQHIDNATGSIITRDTIIANMSLPEAEADVVVHALDINNYTLADQQTKTVNVRSGGSATVNFYYNQPGYVKVRHLEQGTGNLLFEEYAIGTVGTQAVVHSKDFTSYQLAPGQSPQNNAEIFEADIESNTIPVVEFYYIPIANPIAGDILIRHVDSDNPMNVLAVEHVHGNVGSQYVAVPKSIPGYLPSLSVPQTGTFGTQPLVIEFQYTYDASNPVDIIHMSDFLAWVNVEHRDKATNILFAASDVLGEFPYSEIQSGVTEKQFTVSAAQFNGFVLDGAAQQQVTIRPGQTVTAVFQYLNRGSDMIPGEYTVVYLDKGNNRAEVGRQTPVLGLPRDAVDLSTLILPAGYRFSSDNVGQVIFPNVTDTLIQVLVEQIPANPIKTNALVTFEDVRGVPVRGVQSRTVTGMAPDGGPLPAEPEQAPQPETATSSSQSSSVASVAEEASSSSAVEASSETGASSGSAAASAAEQQGGEAALPLAGGYSQAQNTGVVQLSALRPANTAHRVVPAASGIFQVPVPSANITLTYNEMVAGCVPGVPYSVLPIVPQGYTVTSPASTNLLFFEQGVELNGEFYLPYTVKLRPNMVNMRLTLKNEQGSVLGHITKQVPWNTTVNNTNVGQYITGYDAYTIIKVQDPNGAQSVSLNEYAVFIASEDIYPIDVIMRGASNSVPENGGGGGTTSSSSSSSVKSRPSTSSVPSSSLAESSSEADGDTSSSASAASSSAVNSSATSGGSSSEAVNTDTSGTNRSIVEIVGSMVPFANYFSSPEAAFVFYIVLLAVLALLVALLLGASISIQYTFEQNEQETTKRSRKFFKTIRAEKGLFLDISKQEAAPYLDECYMQIQFGWLYRKHLQNTTLTLAFQGKTLALGLVEKPAKGKIACNGNEFV